MHEHSYTKEDLRQILLNIAMPCPQPQKQPKTTIVLQTEQAQEQEQKQEQEQAQAPVEKNSLKINILKHLPADTSQKILKRWPLLVNNFKAKQKEPERTPQDTKKLRELKEENDRLTHTIGQLTQSLASYKALAKAKDQDTKTFHDLQKEHNRLADEITQQKASFSRLLCDRKELDDKIACIDQEKVTLLAKLKEFSIKNSSQVIQLQDLQKRHIEQEQEKASLKEQLFEKEANATKAKEEVTRALATICEKQEKLEHEQAKYASLHALYEQIVKQKDELEVHGKQLEQHLARRVKECALALKQGEELTKECELLKHNLTSIDTNFQSTLQTLELIKKEHEELSTQNRCQLQELEILKKEKERFSQIEQLFSQCEKIFAKTSHE